MVFDAQKRRCLIGYITLNEDASKKHHEKLLDVLEAEVPVVEEAEFGSAYVDVTGMERLYPRPFLLMDRLIDCLRRAGIPPEAMSGGMGANKFVAEVAARERGSGRSFFIPPEKSAGFLAPLPVSYLPVHEDVKERFHFLGLTTLGHIARLDTRSLETQFGYDGRFAWMLARGLDPRPVRARRMFRPIEETLVFASPVTEWQAFWIGVRQLLTQAWQRKERNERTVRQIHLAAQTDGQDWERTITLHEPVGELGRLAALLRRRLEGGYPEGAVMSLSVQLTSLGPLYAGQLSLFPGSSRRWEQIKEALSGIKARDGSSGLYRVAEVEPWSRIPERRYALIDFDL